MKMEFEGAKISGVHLVVPKNEISFESEIDQYTFSAAQSRKLKSVMGYDRRRVVEPGVVSSDLVISGFKHLIINENLDLECIDALVLVTQTPDYLMPGTSFIVHNALPFKKDIVCMDLNQGCSGFINGMIASLSLLAQRNINRVALVNVDVLSRLVAFGDRNSRPIIGDAASITIVDSNESSSSISCVSKVDGSGWDALMIPAGGLKMRPSDETAESKEDESGNVRSLNDLVMKGDAVFNFVMKEVPLLIEDICLDSQVSKDDIDYFLFHQPNPFMLKKIANKLEIPLAKMPHKLVSEFGNSSGVSIPAVLCTSFERQEFDVGKKMCLAGFGVGLSWGAMLMELEKLEFLSLNQF